MGITRVQQRMKADRSRVGFGLGAEEQILSEQAINIEVARVELLHALMGGAENKQLQQELWL